MIVMIDTQSNLNRYMDLAKGHGTGVDLKEMTIGDVKLIAVESGYGRIEALQPQIVLINVDEAKRVSGDKWRDWLKVLYLNSALIMDCGEDIFVRSYAQ